jgi:hypothetical protein
VTPLFDGESHLTDGVVVGEHRERRRSRSPSRPD